VGFPWVQCGRLWAVSPSATGPQPEGGTRRRPKDIRACRVAAQCRDRASGSRSSRREGLCIWRIGGSCARHPLENTGHKRRTLGALLWRQCGLWWFNGPVNGISRPRHRLIDRLGLGVAQRRNVRRRRALAAAGPVPFQHRRADCPLRIDRQRLDPIHHHGFGQMVRVIRTPVV
jgi:hypothetical protein